MDALIRQLKKAELPIAEKLCRDWLQTFFGPTAALTREEGRVGKRFDLFPRGVLVAEVDGELAGVCCAAQRGSVLCVGPVALRARGPTRNAPLALLTAMGTLAVQVRAATQVAYTLPHSAMQLKLYSQLGFEAQHLTAVMTASVRSTKSGDSLALSSLPAEDRAQVLGQIDALTQTHFDGFGARAELEATLATGLGEVLVLVGADGAVDGFALVHLARSGEPQPAFAEVKLAMVRAGREAPERFDALLDSLHALGAERGVGRWVLSVSTVHHLAYQRLLERGFQTAFTCASMHRPPSPKFNREEGWVLMDVP